MTFNVISATKGTYRHVATGFVVHETYSIASVVEANGALVEYGNGAWRWLVGRDLRDFIRTRGVTTLQQLVNEMAKAFFVGGLTIHHNNYASGKLHCYPGGTDVPTAGAKLFAILNNCFAGHGHSGNSAWHQRGVNQNVGLVTPSTAIPQIGTGAASSYANKDANTHGVAIIAVPLKVTWAAALDKIYATYEHATKSEVAAKLAAGKTRALSWIAANAPAAPYMYVPVILHIDGVPRVIPPLRDHMTSSGPLVARIPRPLGTTMCDTLGARLTNPLTAEITLASSTGWGYQNSPDGPLASYTPSTATPYTTYQHMTALDGVRVERILGGLSGVLLSSAGEMAVGTESNVLSQSLRDVWMQSFYPYTGSEVARIVVNGSVESDAQYVARVEGMYPGLSAQAACADAFTNYDSTAFSLNHLCWLANAAVDPEKVQKLHFARFGATVDGAFTGATPQFGNIVGHSSLGYLADPLF